MTSIARKKTPSTPPNIRKTAQKKKSLLKRLGGLHEETKKMFRPGEQEKKKKLEETKRQKRGPETGGQVKAVCSTQQTWTQPQGADRVNERKSQKTGKSRVLAGKRVPEGYDGGLGGRQQHAGPRGHPEWRKRECEGPRLPVQKQTGNGGEQGKTGPY